MQIQFLRYYKTSLSIGFIVSNPSEMREGTRPDASKDSREKNGWKENKQVTVEIEWSICTNKLPSDQLKRRLRTWKGEREKNGSADWVGSRARDQSCFRSKSPLFEVIDVNSTAITIICSPSRIYYTAFNHCLFSFIFSTILFILYIYAILLTHIIKRWHTHAHIFIIFLQISKLFSNSFNM